VHPPDGVLSRNPELVLYQILLWRRRSSAGAL
jgi:hypothetical protein